MKSSNLIVERFDFIANQCNWTIETRLLTWKKIALQSIEAGGSLEEKILLYLTEVEKESTK